MPVAKPAPISPGLSGVSETMLWSLYNRASEARRPDAVLDDAGSIRIQDAIDYDFAGQFGPPAGSLAVRAAAIDRELRAWLVRHPHGLVVSLGEGLETQSRRVDNGTMRWLSVDLPAAKNSCLLRTGSATSQPPPSIRRGWMLSIPRAVCSSLRKDC